MKTIKKFTTEKRIALFLSKVEACKNTENLSSQEQRNRIDEAKAMLKYLPKWAAEEYERQLKHVAITEKNKIEKELLKKYRMALTTLLLPIEAKYVTDLDKMEHVRRQVENTFKKLIRKLKEVTYVQYSTEAQIETEINNALFNVDAAIFTSDIPGCFNYSNEKLLKYFDLLEKKDEKEKVLTLF